VASQLQLNFANIFKTFLDEIDKQTTTNNSNNNNSLTTIEKKIEKVFNETVSELDRDFLKKDFLKQQIGGTHLKQNGFF
jgi:ribosome recycling factor